MERIRVRYAITVAYWFHLNRSEILSSFKRDLLRLKRAPINSNSSLQISIFQILQIFDISYSQFKLSFKKKYLFPKMPKNHPNIYTKPQNIGLCSKWRDLALVEMCSRHWHKWHVERRQNSLQVKSRLNCFLASSYEPSFLLFSIVILLLFIYALINLFVLVTCLIFFNFWLHLHVKCTILR